MSNRDASMWQPTTQRGPHGWHPAAERVADESLYGVAAEACRLRIVAALRARSLAAKLNRELRAERRVQRETEQGTRQ